MKTILWKYLKNRKDIKKDYDKVDESAMGRTLKLVGSKKVVNRCQKVIGKQ